MRAKTISLFGLLCTLAAGCGGGTENTITGDGLAYVQVDTSQLTAFDVTRVTVEASGVFQDLTFDGDTSLFGGALLLPVGAHDIVARAYEGAGQVGESNPIMVDIQSGIVTRVTIRILDTTGGNQPDYGPILEALSYPESAEEGALVTFSASVIDPDGDPIAYDWSDDCADATFTTAQAAATDWSKATLGQCRITFTATANGLALAESFSIVVFAAGANSGAANIDGVFVPASQIYLDLSYGGQTCHVDQESNNASCSRSIASPEVAGIFAFTDWNNGNSATLELFDDCGGTVSGDPNDPATGGGSVWLPPVTGGVCRVSARATNDEGVVSTLSAAVLVLDGTPRTASPPSINMDLNGPMGFCHVDNNTSPADCGLISPSEPRSLNVFVDWLDGLPGAVTVTDDCGGSFNLNSDPQGSQLFGDWFSPAAPGTVCNVTASATSLEGAATQITGTFTIQ